MTNRVVTSLTFHVIDEIGGEGANSKAYLAHDPQLNTQLVVKKIPKADFTKQEQYYTEAQILYGNKHPNIMEINYACEDKDNIYLSMPYHINGSLNSLINSKFLSVREIINYSLDFLSGLHYIHTQKLIHFDIKPTNIIIDSSNRALLTDFGLSAYSNTQGFATPEKVYGVHSVPEAFVTPDLSNQYDIYQAGLTIYRMCNGNDDFKIQSVGLTKEQITQGKFPLRDQFLPHIPNALRNCVKVALKINPDERYKTVLDLMNDISSINENLDWIFSCSNGFRTWVCENDNTIKTLTLTSDGAVWKTEGFSTSKKTGRQVRIKRAFTDHNSEENAQKEIRKIFKGI